MNEIGEQDVVIVGAGPAGLTAALELQRRSGLRPLVFEADTQVGGISKTVEYRGNRMDLGGHRFFSKSDWVMNWWQEILPVEADQVKGGVELGYQSSRRSFVADPAGAAAQSEGMLIRQRLSRILYQRKLYDYPIRLSPRTVANLGLVRTARIGTSYALARLRPRTPEVTLADFLVNRFGEQLYLTFFKSYTEKVWGVPCEQISAEWGAQRIKGLSIGRALAHAARSLLPRSGALAQRETETSLIERFLYPRRGPGQMWEAVAARVTSVGGQIHLRHRVVGIRRLGQRVTGVDVLDTASGLVRHVPCRHLISSMPVGELVRQLGPESPEVLQTANALPHRDFMTAGLLLRRVARQGADRGRSAPDASRPPDNWIYVQEDDVRLGRIQIFNNWSPYLVRDPATSWLGLEYFCDAGDDLWSMPDATFLDFAAAELERIGFADRKDVLDGTVVRVPKAYPAYFGAYDQIGRLRDYLQPFENIFPVGRNGMHRYNNQDHSMLTARAAVDCIVSGSRDKSVLWAINTDDEYHEERSPAN